MKDHTEMKEHLYRLEYSESQSVETNHADNPHIYNSTWEYIISAIGVCVGYGSFWRFPSLVFKNGGGAFLIPYLIAMVLMGMPLLYLETAIGQMHRLSIPFALKKIHPSLKIVGIAIMITGFFLSSVYNILLTYCYRFLFVSLQNPLPFQNEDITSNAYFHQTILNQSSSINEFGGINILLFLIYIGSLIICHLIIKDGAKTSGKIAIVTATAPYVMFIILILRGIFLEGAIEGIAYLFKPNWSLLWNPSIWIDATTQVFYQLAIGVGCMINLSAQKPRRDDITKSIIVVPIGLVLCGLLSALTIFIYLSHFCTLNGYAIGDPQLNISGFQLSFNVLPKALLLLPMPNLWIFIFFVTMVLLGIDSEFGMLEALYCVIRDEWKEGTKKLYGIKISQQTARWLLLAAICIGAPTLTSHAGIYYLGFYDTFICTIPFTVWVTLELFFFVHVFRLEQLTSAIYHYTKKETPWIIQYCLQSYWLPILLLANIFFATINQLLSFRQYSFGFYLLGWMITLFPFLLCFFSLKKQWRGWNEMKLTFQALKHHQIQF